MTPLAPRVVQNVSVGTATSPLAAGLAAPSASAESLAFDSIPLPVASGAKLRSSPTNNGSWLAAWNIMDQAHDHIDASYFIFNRDIYGYAFLGQLLRKQRAGVKVRLLLDATGDSFGLSSFTNKLRGQDYLQELVEAGAQVSIYNPYHVKLPKQLADLSSTEGISANHDKILATERFAMTGGRNVADDYFADDADMPGVYRDGDVVLDSPEAARGLSAAVMTEMNRRDLTMPVGKDAFGNWSPKDAELLGVANLMDAWLQRPAPSEAEKTRLRGSERARNALADDLVAAAIAAAKARGEPVASRGSLVSHARELVGHLELAGDGRGYDLRRGMTSGDVKILDRTSVGTGALGHDEIAPGLAAIVDAAQHRLLITNPYVALSEAVREKLEAAGRRGVRIDLLTNSPGTAEGAASQAFFYNEWPKLLARIPNLHIYVFAGERGLHAKTGVADGEIASIGSFNLDIISSDINGEVIALTRSKALARDLEASFRADMKDPRNGVLEYTIVRDAQGNPVLRNGEPIIAFGPENHITPTQSFISRTIAEIADYAAKHLPQLSPLTESQP